MSIRPDLDAALPEITPRDRALMIGVGIALILLGLAAIAFPFVSSLSVAWMVGILLLAAGVAQGVGAFGYPGWGGGLLAFAVAALWVIVGVYLVFSPFEGLFALTFVVAALFLVEGIVKGVMAFRMRPVAGWGWLLADGVVTFALGAMLWWQLPSSAEWALGTLAGLSITFSGWTLVMMPILLGRMQSDGAEDATWAR
jgi:uncharacterized membrane protein HdeD (DUF308 family)